MSDYSYYAAFPVNSFMLRCQKKNILKNFLKKKKSVIGTLM